ncbi:MAG: 3-dehydroquinate synthase [Thermoleophilia bacterium]
MTETPTLANLRLAAPIPSRAYEVVVGSNELARLGTHVHAVSPGGRVVVCCDENVAPLYLETARESLRDAGFDVSHVVVPAGETQKNLARAEELYGVLYDRGLRRSDTLVALGGGVIGDLIGFVAATFQRGLRLVQVPTTLLAQVDAGIGGKVGVDFRAGKNYVGCFYQPSLVVVDVATLTTLPLRELRSGAAEVAKYGFMEGGELMSECEHLASAPLSADRVARTLVAACIRRKIEVVAEDEREERGGRAVLNLGHTIGHAIEAATGFARYSHGEAVGLGLRAALRLSTACCGLAADEATRGQALLDGLGLPERATGTTPDAVCALTRRDKKAAKDGVGYVLLEALGVPRLGVIVPPELEREAVEWLFQR